MPLSRWEEEGGLGFNSDLLTEGISIEIGKLINDRGDCVLWVIFGITLISKTRYTYLSRSNHIRFLQLSHGSSLGIPSDE